MEFNFNIPNRITLIRVLLIPLFAAVLLADIPYKNYFSAFIFLMLSASDAFDGYLARKKKQNTEFGVLIDPIADKLLISTALVILIGKGVEEWMAFAIIFREVLLTLVRIYLIPMKISIPASNFGKSKTAVQSIAVAAALLDLGFGWYPPLVKIMMIIAVFLTLGSGVEYLVRIRKMTGNKIVNLPNVITLTRLLMVYPFAHYLLAGKTSIAMAFLAAITLGDKLDGISARMMNQMTDLGSFFDSATDVIFIIVTSFLFVKIGYLTLSYTIALMVPAAIIGMIKVYKFVNKKTASSSVIGKVAVGWAYLTGAAVFIDFAYKELLLTAGLVMAYITLFMFVVRLRK